jgi:methylmalonyl-CoA/ethylmalonyl-CoA epimerase
MTKRHIHHVGILTADLDKALKFWRDGLGLPVQKTEHNALEKVDIVFLETDGSAIELIAPTTDDSGIAKHLAKKGEGQHHVCIEVDDIVAMMEHLTAQGFELINETPRTRHDGTLYAFTHPKSTGGVMVELYQMPKE